MPETSILNVDDYAPGRYARTKVLTRNGFPVIEAGTGSEALRLVAEHKPSLVLLDVNLPDMSGLEVCRRIRGNIETAATTIVHISASNVQSQHLVRGLNSGADGYLVEPIEPEVLIATVNAFLRARRAEDELRKTSEELRWFSYRVAHDLNEPLRTITVYAQMLKKLQSGDAGSEAPKCVDFIIDGALRMRSFIDGLLDYSEGSAESGEKCAVDCEALLERVTASLDGAIRESGARILHESLPVVQSNARLEYVFQNLISNAIKYRRGDVPPEIRIAARQDGEFWVFTVADNGIGIEAAYLQRVFEVFQRLHGREIPGNGIGLALCRKIINAQGGAIWVDSEPGSGATFSFTLPVSGAAGPANPS